MVKYLIDLFCGIGGVSYGFSKNGYRVHMAVDSWDDALEVHKKHNPDTLHLLMKLGTTKAKKTIIELLPRLKRGDRLHIHASPPCQNLSMMNIHFVAMKIRH